MNEFNTPIIGEKELIDALTKANELLESEKEAHLQTRKELEGLHDIISRLEIQFEQNGECEIFAKRFDNNTTKKLLEIIARKLVTKK